MVGFPGLTKLLMALQAFALMAVIIRLLASGLARTYKFFFWYLVAFGAQTAAPLLLNIRTKEYLQVFMITEGIITCLYALVILELYSLVLKGHPGIASTAKKYIRVGLAGAILLSILLLEAERVPSFVLDRFFTIERTMVSSILFFVLAITIFLAYFPVPLSRNTVYYSVGYAVYFTSKATVLFIWNTGHAWYRILDFVLLVVSTGCMLLWAICLSRGGEKKPSVIGHKWAPGDDQRVLRQLEAINASLSRSRKEIPTNFR